MFVYFDKNGVVREVINDKSIRQGSYNVNAIYCYFEELTPDDVFVVTQWGDLTKTKEVSIIDNVSVATIPYNKERDLKFFKDFKSYTFYVYELKDIGSDGLALTTVRVVKDGGMFALGQLTFNVEGNVVQTDVNITQSQYDYLVTLVARNNLEIETIKYDAEVVTPTGIEAIPSRDILKIHAQPNFSIGKMTEFLGSKDVEDMWFGCGVSINEPVGFALDFDNAQIGKLQILINGNKYGKPFDLKCYAYVNGAKELVDTITIPPMEHGVFAFYRFNVYKTDVTRIEIVQEEDWTKDRFYIKAIEPFILTGKGQYVITQKNGIISKIDNPDETYLDVVYQFVLDQMTWLENNINLVAENTELSRQYAEATQEDKVYIDEVAKEIKDINTTIQTQKPQIESDLAEATGTLNTILKTLNQPNGFLELGVDGKVPASRLPVEKTFDIFPISNENQLTGLSGANIGDIAFVSKKIDGTTMATENYRLVAEPYSVRSNWVLQATTYSSHSAFAERSGIADNSSMINGITLRKTTLKDYNSLADKTGVFIVTL